MPVVFIEAPPGIRLEAKKKRVRVTSIWSSGTGASLTVQGHPGTRQTLEFATVTLRRLEIWAALQRRKRSTRTAGWLLRDLSTCLDNRN